MIHMATSSLAAVIPLITLAVTTIDCPAVVAIRLFRVLTISSATISA